MWGALSAAQPESEGCTVSEPLSSVTTLQLSLYSAACAGHTVSCVMRLMCPPPQVVKKAFPTERVGVVCICDNKYQVHYQVDLCRNTI